MIKIPFINEQPQEKILHNDKGEALDVVDVWRTIQGEGPHAGVPAVFIRLAGCTLQCGWCDAQYTEGRKLTSLDQLREKIMMHMEDKTGLLVITGGEPFRQNISPFLQLMCSKEPHIKMQIETNGTCTRFVPTGVDVVCSPKTSKIAKTLAPMVTAWKYIVHKDATSLIDGLPTESLGYGQKVARPLNDAEVFIQPLDTLDSNLNIENLNTAAEVCMKHGYRLCLQVQKYINMP